MITLPARTPRRRSAETPEVKPGLWSRLDERGRQGVVLIVAVAAAAMTSMGTDMARMLIGLAGFIVFLLIALSNRGTAMAMIVAWLAVLGFLRRLLIPFVGWSSLDPLLLVNPAAAVLLWVTAGRDRRLGLTPMGGVAAFLLLLTVAQIFNPGEASVLTGAQGAMFHATPLMWFFVGRTLTGREHTRILNTVIIADIVVVTHALYQTFVGLLPFEYTWLDVSGQGASIFLAGFKVRPFSTLVSPQECGYFLMFATQILAARLYHPLPKDTLRLRRGFVVLLAATLTALFFMGQRGALIFTIIGLATMTVTKSRSLLSFLLVLLGGAGVVFFVGQQSVKPVELEQSHVESTSSVIVSHQLTGLTNPSESSAGLHIAQAVKGLRDAVENPLGFGASMATLAQHKADPNRPPTPEYDIGNTMVALGIPGGLALIALVVLGLAGAARAYSWRPCARHLAWFAILVAALTQWLSGAMYSVSTILFVSLGGLDRMLAIRSGDIPPDDVPTAAPVIPARGVAGRRHQPGEEITTR